MLATLRATASRTVLRPTRALSSTSVARSDILGQTLKEIGEISSGGKTSFKGIASETLELEPFPTTPAYNNTSKPLILIPPAQDPLLTYISNTIMRDGKRTQADRTVTKMLTLIHTMTRAPPLPIVREAVLSASPLVKCISQRRSVKVTQKPIALSERHRTAYGVKWILWASAARPEPTLEGRLAREIVAVLQGDSRALSKKAEVHRQAMINR